MHISVLLEESIKYLNLKSDSKIIDCTLGYGGHSSEILKRIPNGFLYSFDQDKEAIKYSDERLKKIGTNYKIINSNFVNLKENGSIYSGFSIDILVQLVLRPSLYTLKYKRFGFL